MKPLRPPIYNDTTIEAPPTDHCRPHLPLSPPSTPPIQHNDLEICKASFGWLILSLLSDAEVRLADLSRTYGKESMKASRSEFFWVKKVFNFGSIIKFSAICSQSGQKEMMAVTWPAFADMHPFAPSKQAQGCQGFA
ncbi:hypothetical protein L2E82_21122 [Cichorium intybus]|uniref:Uncharacterized protein n=1 Tax=Cichorium intybus TaxID=13427 RepID=A0ACB9DV09_CICIN|nr:hypothetical protein L2E82_21122 [Cichorium intybus]